MSIPKIAVDVQFLHDQYYRRGIGRYGVEMVSRLIKKKSATTEIHLVGFGTLDSNLDKLGILDHHSVRKVRFHSLGRPQDSRPLANINIFLRRLRPTLKEIAPDIYFAPYFERLIASKTVPTVTTIYDLIPLVTGNYSKQGAIKNWLKGVYYRRALKQTEHCKAVFTISHHAEKDILKYTSIDSDKLHVTYLGVSKVFTKSNLKSANEQLLDLFPQFDQLPGYILYDTGLEANKNPASLLKLLKLIHDRGQNTYLVITGGDFEPISSGSLKSRNERATEFIQMAEALGLEKHLLPVGKVSEPDLAGLFREATLYANMSDYEGFGLGPVQAMASGVPAAISNKSSFPEVAGNAAVLVDAHNLEHEIDRIMPLITDEHQRQLYIDRGLNQAKKYNWDNTFEQTWEIIRHHLN